MLDRTAQASVRRHIASAQGFDAFVETVQRQGPPTKDSGWARLEPIVLKSGEPARNAKGEIIYRWQLSDTTLKSLPPLLSQALQPALNDPALKGLCWTVQNGIVPGEEQGSSAAQQWTLRSLAPTYGIAISAIDFAAAGSAFRLTLNNDIPRHLGVYTQFLNNRQPVQPAGWASRLPPGVPAGFETATLKYLGLLAPTTAVAGLPVATTPQTLDLALPSGADSASVLLGGIGNGGWQSLADTAGVMLTFVLDYAIPAILMSAGAGIEKAPWFRGLLADQSMLSAIMAAGEFLLSDPAIVDTSTLLARMADSIAGLLLDQGLQDLRDDINANVGDQAVENAAPFLGWSAQTLEALLDAQNAATGALTPATPRLLAIPATLPIALSPAMVFDLQVSLAPDPARGEWPDDADHYEARVDYAGGFSQRQSGPVPQIPPAAPLSVTFGSVRGDPIGVLAAVYAKDNTPRARGATTIAAPFVPPGRLVQATVPLADQPVVIGANTRYSHKRVLTYNASANQYAWALSGAPSAVSATLAPCDPTRAGLCGLVSITLQEAARSIGYAWRVSGAGLQECGGGAGPINVAYLFQNIGCVNPNDALKSLSCGFIQQPYLVYQRPAAAAGRNNFYLDPRDSGAYLRDVVLDGHTPFDLTGKKSRGQFRESNLSGIAIHPAGYAAAVSGENSCLEILKLADAPVGDAEAPTALLIAGAGTRAGLLDGPVGLTITPEGDILTLESGGARVQAFDLYGNPVPRFNGSPFLALTPETGVEYQDIAIGPQGLIYILSNLNGGKQPSDYRLDIYTPDGSFLARTEGVNGGRLAIDTQGRVYTLNYESISGPNGRAEPSISEWVPSAG